MSKAHLTTAEILKSNAKILADSQRRDGVNFLGPQMTFHRKPNAGGGACEVCGCLGLRIGVRHRALEAGHGVEGAAYVKTHTDCTKDTVETYLGLDGKPARRAA